MIVWEFVYIKVSNGNPRFGDFYGSSVVKTTERLKVRSLVGKLRSHMLCSITKKEGTIPTCQLYLHVNRVTCLKELRAIFFSFLCFPVYSKTNTMNIDCFFPMGAQSCPTLCSPMDYSPPNSLVHGIVQEEYWSGLPFPILGDSPNPRIEPTSPASLLHCRHIFYH